VVKLVFVLYHDLTPSYTRHNMEQEVIIIIIIIIITIIPSKLAVVIS
jgi:hypothetical protein